jgi:antitoxin HicB
MERQGMTKATLAEKMHTSRAQVDRILKAKGNITIDTLQRAAALVGRQLRLELIHGSLPQFASCRHSRGLLHQEV